jgi:hypothetical protein
MEVASLCYMYHLLTFGKAITPLPYLLSCVEFGAFGAFVKLQARFLVFLDVYRST